MELLIYPVKAEWLSEFLGNIWAMLMPYFQSLELETQYIQCELLVPLRSVLAGQSK